MSHSEGDTRVQTREYREAFRREGQPVTLN